MNDINAEFQLQMEMYLEGIAVEMKTLFQDAIRETVYDVSNPDITWYQRTEDFVNAVDTEFKDDGSLLVFINTDKLNYYSWVNFQQTDKNMSSAVGWFIEEGHNGGYGYGMYKDYSPRKFLESAYEKINNRYPDLQLEIINEAPDWV